MNIEEKIRRFYAATVVLGKAKNYDRLVEAFATVPRERYVGPGPWHVCTGDDYIDTPSSDLAFLYQDNLIALSKERRINNGQPSLHAVCLDAAAPKAGESVVHIGAGTGYYTALLRELVGPAGSLVAYEIDRDLAAKAVENLQDFPNVTVRCRSGAQARLPDCDVIYVNAGVTELPDVWLDALRLRGRLVVPLTPKHEFGGMLLITRKSDDRFDAHFVSGAMFIPCVGVCDDAASARLTEAFHRGGMRDVRSLRRREPTDASCWYAGGNWWLSTAAPPRT